MPLTVVLGGARSGKGDLAEHLAANQGRRVCHLRARAHAAAGGTTTAGGSAALAHDGLTAALAEARGATIVVDDWETFLAELLGMSGDLLHPVGAPAVRSDESAELVDAAVDALAHWEHLSVVVADGVDGTVQRDGIDASWPDLLARATQRLTSSADHLVLAVAGRPVEVPSVRETRPVDADGLREQTDVVVAHGAEDFANLVVEEGPPQWLQTVLRDALEVDVRRYPDEREAVGSIAARHGRDPSEVVLTNGAVDACWLLAATLRPRNAVCIGPTFVEPEVALGAFGHHVHRATRSREAGFMLDPGLVPMSADYVALGNPNNPTGGLDPAAAIRSLTRSGRIIVVDEAFMEFVPGERETLANESLPGVIVLRSVTKLLSIPGLRAGYLLAPPEIAAQLRLRRAKWAVNALALAALAAWNRRPRAGEEIARRVGRWRRDLVKRIGEIPGVEVYPATANFVLVRVPNGPAVVSQLTELGVAVRPAGSFPGLSPNDVRITVRSPAANARLAAALHVALSPASGAEP